MARFDPRILRISGMTGSAGAPGTGDSAVVYQLVVETMSLPDPSDVHPNAPLRLVEAVWLPELGGQFSEKMLRTAIGAGLLPAEQHGRALYVTRTGIRDWRENCRVSRRVPVYGSSRNGSTATGSAARPSGSSETDGLRSAQAAAEMTFAALRNSLRRT